MDYSLEYDIIEGFPKRFLQSNILLYCVILLLVLKIASSLVFINFPQNIFFADITKTALENFANQTRQSLGLRPLSENEKLNQAAMFKARNMVQNQYFSHTSPSGIAPWFWFKQAGYNYRYAGENLAVGFFESQDVYNAWLNSPSHKANIINPNYTEVGTAVLTGFGQNNAIIVVQEFASPLPVKQVAPKNNITQPVATKPKPDVKPQTPPAQTGEKVLSEQTEDKSYLEPQIKDGANDLYSKTLNFVLYSHDKLLQNIIYGVSLVVIGAMLLLIFGNLNFNFNKGLIFRSVVIIILLSAAMLLDSRLVALLVPHQITI